MAQRCYSLGVWWKDKGKIVAEIQGRLEQEGWQIDKLPLGVGAEGIFVISREGSATGLVMILLGKGSVGFVDLAHINTLAGLVNEGTKAVLLTTREVPELVREAADKLSVAIVERTGAQDLSGGLVEVMGVRSILLS